MAKSSKHKIESVEAACCGNQAEPVGNTTGPKCDLTICCDQGHKFAGVRLCWIEPIEGSEWSRLILEETATGRLFGVRVKACGG